jgi:DNA-binding NtrC family response regulator
MPQSKIDLYQAKILIVDDLPVNIDVLYKSLRAEGYQVLAATDGATALKVVAQERPDLVLLDVMMPLGINGFEVCAQLKANPDVQDIPVIFLTAVEETPMVVKGFELGGVDYVTKPFKFEEVLVRIRTHLEHAFLTRALAEKNRELEAEIAHRTVLDNRLTMLSEQEKDRWGISGFVGENQTIQEILKNISLIQNAERLSVLITGESGTGKELIARAIHAGSARCEAPFVVVNCATIPAALAESMLFGHLKGAFTGAERDQMGYFELANGGTLFLDEIGAMPADLQPKLLRVLEDGLIRPLGADKDKQVDVRILSATNEPKGFREDLYYRLARFTVELPPLRERKEDISVLGQHFLHLFASEMRIVVPNMTSEAYAKLEAYDYPGNVRELKNIVERALIMSGGETIGPQHLQIGQAGERDVNVSSGETLSVDDLPLNLDQAEMLLMQRAIRIAGGNLTEAARLMGINRAKIYRKIAQVEEL